MYLLLLTYSVDFNSFNKSHDGNDINNDNKNNNNTDENKNKMKII